MPITSERLTPAESRLRTVIYSDTDRVMQVLYLLSIVCLTNSGLCPMQNKHDPVSIGVRFGVETHLSHCSNIQEVLN